MKLKSNVTLGATSCSLSSISLKADLTDIEKENMASAESMLAASKLLVDVGHNLIPSEGLEEGSPIRRTNESVRRTRPPDRDYGSCESGIVGASLQRLDDIALVGRGLRSEGLCEGNDDQGDPLFLEVGDFEFIHGICGSVNSLANSGIMPLCV